jgi:hypothetical protein
MQKTFIPAAAIASQHADVLAWITGNPANEFAASLGKQLKRYKQLSEGQINAVKAKLAPKAAPVALEVGAGVALIAEAFATALENGKKKPKLRLAGFKFSPANAEGKNPGAIYVKAGSEYMGKIFEGKFMPVKACGDEQRAEIIKLASSPKEAAIAHGMETGTCACCGRELTDPNSIAMGIGPDCAAGYGW